MNFSRELNKVGENSFAVLPQSQLFNFCQYKTPSEPFAVISITDSENEYDPKVPGSSKLKGVLYLRFDDVEEDQVFGRLKVFSEEQAKTVWAFVDEMVKQDVKSWVIHCYAGICRSSAMAAAIATRLGDDPSFFFSSYMPNMTVYRKLLDSMPS